MYQITNRDTGELIGFTNKLRYIFYVEDAKTIILMNDKSLAHGIAINCTPYNITKEEKIPNAAFVYITEVDEGEYIFRDHNQVVKSIEEINTMQQLILEQDNSIGLLEEALIDLDNHTVKNIIAEE